MGPILKYTSDAVCFCSIRQLKMKSHETGISNFASDNYSYKPCRRDTGTPLSIYLSIYRRKLAFSLLIALSVCLSFSNIKYPENQVWSDMEGYYVYLPSVFIYGDFVREAVRDTGYIRPYKDTGKIYTKYTCGVALMEMPFFLAAHTIATITGTGDGGKSPVYGRGLTMAGLFYMWLGMYFLFRLGRRYYARWPVVLSLAALLLGTNLYYYTFFQPAMSHVFSFCLFAAFLLMTDTLVARSISSGSEPSPSAWGLYGFVLGMIILVRPTNILMALWPLYIWYKSCTDKSLWMRTHLTCLLTAVAVFTVPFIPQLVYWKYISGQWILWSYEGESFKYWKEPKLFRVLFDAWNGWILYSPVVVVPLYFLWKGRHTNRYYERGTIWILALATWLFASWWAWWFGGAFGHRSYVEFLTVLAMPFAGAADCWLRRCRPGWLFVCLIAVLCYYSLGLTYAYRPPWDGDGWTYASLWLEIKKLFCLVT